MCLEQESQPKYSRQKATAGFAHTGKKKRVEQQLIHDCENREGTAAQSKLAAKPKTVKGKNQLKGQTGFSDEEKGKPHKI